LKAFLLLAMLVASSPAQAQDLRTSATKFCNAARQINAQNLSVAPGSYASEMIAARASQSSEQYRNLWIIAKALDIPSCRAMW
jgi:hypothetical protein